MRDTRTKPPFVHTKKSFKRWCRRVHHAHWGMLYWEQIFIEYEVIPDPLKKGLWFWEWKGVVNAFERK